MLLYLGRYQEAEASLLNAIKIDKTAHAYHALGNVYEQQQQKQKAYLTFKTATEIDPNHADAYFNMGTVLQQMRRHEEAIPAFETSAELDKTSGSALVNMGVSLKALGRIEEAIGMWELWLFMMLMRV